MRFFATFLVILSTLLVSPITRAEEPPAAQETPAQGSTPQASVTNIADGVITRLELLHADAAKLMAQNKPREAVALYIEILLIEPDDDAAYTNMGQAYLLLGDAIRAQDTFLNALNIDPENEIAVAGLKSIADPDGTIASGEMRDSLEKPSEEEPSEK